MSLLEYLQYLTKIQTIISNITTIKAITILLEEERKGEKPKDLEEIVPVYSLTIVRRPSCKTYRKNYSGIYQDKRSNLVLEQLQKKRGNKRKRIELAKIVLAYTFQQLYRLEYQDGTYVRMTSTRIVILEYQDSTYIRIVRQYITLRGYIRQDGEYQNTYIQAVVQNLYIALFFSLSNAGNRGVLEFSP